MKRKYVSIYLVSIILASIFLVGFTNYNEDVELKKKMTIMIVPLDDRPVNIDFPKSIADILEVNIMLPPKEIIGSRLEKGDSEKIKNWALENSKYADAFIISLTMINHGGLNHSRLIENDNFLIDFDWLKELKDKNPNKKIYAFDTIQRLSISVNNKYEKDLYDNIQTWAKSYNSVDSNKLKDLENKIPTDIKNKYLYTRAVNLSLNLEAIKLVDEGIIDYLVLSQDDAAEKGIHLLDQYIIKEKIKELAVEDKISIITGTDEVELCLLMKHILNYHNYRPRISVQYINEEKKADIYPFEDKSLDKTISEHIKLCGAFYVETAADLHLFVYNSVESEYVTLDFIRRIRDSIEAGKTVGIIDLTNNVSNFSNSDFISLLKNHITLSELGSYSAWNTASNASAISIAHLLAYWYSRNIFVDTELYHQKFLYNRFMNDYIYKVKIKPDLEKYLISVGTDIYNLDGFYGKEYIETYITNNILKYQYDYLLEFDESYRDKIAITKVELPWNRIFEVRIINSN